jgi:hypothetical protein
VVATANAGFGEPIGQPLRVYGQIAIRPGPGAFLLQGQYGLPVTALGKRVDQGTKRA